MCRYVAYLGEPLVLSDILYNPSNSLIHQASDAIESRTRVNADGFGIGWYARDGDAGVYRSTQPAWNDANLRDLAHHIESGLFIAHVRRSTGTAVQQTNLTHDHGPEHGR